MQPYARVVVAEPSDVMSSLLEHIVTRILAWECNSATTGHQAWELVQRLQPDLVIAEGHIRDMDGLELVRRMQSHPRLASIPVVLIDVLDAEARAAGAAATIAKPFGTGALVRTLTQVLHQ